ncbi:MAG: hypothetical protein FWD68_10870 [Alphaproteobacteria bacterium]|nr:hypothetical protein [Alphaproteobacteria bacterium]
MNETEFELLLDIVQDALGDPGTEFPPHHCFRMAVPTAANDNGLEWPLLPFPDDWFAS